MPGRGERGAAGRLGQAVCPGGLGLPDAAASGVGRGRAEWHGPLRGDGPVRGGTGGAPCRGRWARLVLGAVSDAQKPCEILEGHCAEPGVCPLSLMAEGTEVCIRQLLASPEVRARLRELGLGEQQRIKVLSRQANFICQVCNARLGISEEIAQAILVEPVSEPPSSGVAHG